MDHNYISTKKKRVRYSFVTPTNVVENKQNIRPIIYIYQICIYKNPYDHKFHLRRFAVSPNNEFIDLKYYKLDKKQCKKFVKSTPPNKYKSYSTYSLENIEYPTLSDIFLSQSDILESNYNYSGYAPFHKY
jgi:hypothetical protein